MASVNRPYRRPISSGPVIVERPIPGGREGPTEFVSSPEENAGAWWRALALFGALVLGEGLFLLWGYNSGELIVLGIVLVMLDVVFAQAYGREYGTAILGAAALSIGVWLCGYLTDPSILYEWAVPLPGVLGTEFQWILMAMAIAGFVLLVLGLARSMQISNAPDSD